MIILRVALDVPLPKLFDYLAEDAARADIGARVLVPFGKKHRVGVIVDVAARSEVADSRLRAVDRVLHDAPPLAHEWLDLARFCSDYYQRPLGEVVATALPPRLRTARPVPSAPVDYVLTPSGGDALAAMPARRKRLRALLSQLARGRTSESEFSGGTRSPAQKESRSRLGRHCRSTAVRDPLCPCARTHGGAAAGGRAPALGT